MTSESKVLDMSFSLIYKFFKRFWVVGWIIAAGLTEVAGSYEVLYDIEPKRRTLWSDPT